MKKSTSKKNIATTPRGIKSLFQRTPRGTDSAHDSNAKHASATSAAAASPPPTPGTVTPPTIASASLPEIGSGSALKIHKSDQVISCDSSSSSSNGTLSSACIVTDKQQRNVRTSRVVVSGSSEAAARYSTMKDSMTETDTGVPFIEYFAVYQQSSASSVVRVYAMQSPTALKRAVPTPADVDKHITRILSVEFASHAPPIRYNSAESMRKEFGTIQNPLECCYADTAFIVVMKSLSKFFALCVQVPSVLEDRCLIQPQDDALSTEKKTLTYHRRAYVIMSSQPIITLMWNFFETLCYAELMHMWCKYVMGSVGVEPHIKSGATLNALMSRLCTTPMPEANIAVNVKFTKSVVSVRVIPSAEIGFPSLANFTITTLLQIGVPDIVRILKHLMCDFSVIFKGSSAGVLTACMLGILSILGTFKWVNEVFGIVSGDQLTALQSPAPYVAAVLFSRRDSDRKDTAEKIAIDKACEDATTDSPKLVVDVDTRTLLLVPDYAMEMPCSDKLQAELSRPASLLLAQHTVSSMARHTWVNLDAENATYLKEIQLIIESYCVYLINSVRRHLPFKCYPSEASIDDAAERKRLVGIAFPSRFHAFYSCLLQSSVWANVIAPQFTPTNMTPEGEGVFKDLKLQ